MFKNRAPVVRLSDQPLAAMVVKILPARSIEQRVIDASYLSYRMFIAQRVAGTDTPVTYELWLEANNNISRRRYDNIVTAENWKIFAEQIRRRFTSVGFARLFDCNQRKL